MNSENVLNVCRPLSASLRVLCALLLLVLFFGIPVYANEVAGPYEDSEAHRVVVNGEVLTPDEEQQFVQRYGRVYVGRYWYDPTSGLYGQEGGPPMGQLHAGLKVRGRLAANASGGGDGRMTGTFINGREIHPLEHAFYQQVLGHVWPGQFWMNDRGQGGYLFGGLPGPMVFDIRAAISRSSGSGGSHYLPWIGGKPGTHVGRASDGCVYVSQGGYSSSSC